MTLSAVFGPRKTEKKTENEKNIKLKEEAVLSVFLIFFLFDSTDGRVPGSFHAAAEACLPLRSYKARPLSVINFFIPGLIFIHRAKKEKRKNTRPTGESGGFTTRAATRSKLETAATSKPSTTSTTSSATKAVCSLLLYFHLLYCTFCHVFQIDDHSLVVRDDKELSADAFLFKMQDASRNMAPSPLQLVCYSAC